MKKKICLLFSIFLLVIFGIGIININANATSYNGISFESFSSSLMALLKGKNPVEEADKYFNEQQLTQINNVLMVDAQTFKKVTKTNVTFNETSCDIQSGNKKVSLTNNSSFAVSEDNNIVGLQTAPQVINGNFYFPIEDVSKSLGFEFNKTINKVVLSKPYQTKRLLVKSFSSLNNKGAIKKVEGYKGLHIFEYATEEECKLAFNYYASLNNVNWVEVDSVYSVNEGYENNAENTALNNYKGENVILSGSTPTFYTWGASPMGVDIYRDYLQGLENTRDAIVAVLDTGLYSNHTMFANRICAGGKNFSLSESTTGIEYNDVHGHGTHVAGTIVDLTPSNVKILPIKVLGDEGYSYTSNIVAGIEYVVSLKSGDVVVTDTSFDNLISLNMSLGGSSSAVGSPNQTAYADALTSAYNQNILPVVAAGNDGIDASETSPANVSYAITVAAVGQAGSGFYHPYWSNFGPFIDVCAPGEDIISAKAGTLDERVSLSGTSMASPHVAGAVALLYCGGVNFNQIEDVISNNVIDLGAVGRDDIYGKGLVFVGYAYAEVLEDVVSFSENETDQPSSFSLNLTYSDNNAQIYYTLDNSTPTTSSLLYSGAISINASVTIKARAFILSGDDVLSYSKVSTKSYIINGQDVLNAYTIDNGVLISYNGLLQQVVVPSSYNGQTITKIGSRAFIAADPINVTLPSSVTMLNDYAFFGCNNLVWVKGTGVTKIGARAFYYCEGLENLTDEEFPNVKRISRLAFAFCKSLNDIELSSVEVVESFAFYMNGTSALNLTSVIMPNVVTIGESAFYSAERISAISMGNAEFVGPSAFKGCRISSVNLDSAKYIGAECFEEDTFLTAIALPEAIIIGSKSFYCCSGLTQVEIPNLKRVDSLAFARTSITTLNMPELEIAGAGAFEYISRLTMFSAPKLRIIKTEAFYNCSGLLQINLPSAVVIEHEAFYNFTRATRVMLSQNLEYIAPVAFNNFKDTCVFYIYGSTPAKQFVEEFKSDNNVKIRYVELDNKYELFNYQIVNNEVYIISVNENEETKINIPSYINGLPVTKICESAFENCDAIYNLQLTQLRIIEANAFKNCVNLTSIYLPKIEVISESAFDSCNQLIQVDIENVSSIEANAFKYCGNLLKVKLGKNITSIGTQALGFTITNAIVNNFCIIGYDGVAKTYATNNGITFYNIFNEDFNYYYGYYTNNEVEEVYIAMVETHLSGGLRIPATCNGKVVSKIGESAFENCLLITDIELPSSIITLEDRAFYNCASLKNINLNYVTSIGEECFSHCENLQSVIIPNITEVPQQAFDNCYGLERIEIPNVITIHDQAFRLCVALTDVIADNIEVIGSEGFINSYKLKNINLSHVKLLGTKGEPTNGATAIYGSVFENCYSLGPFVYLVKIEELGDRVFYNSGVENVAIGINFCNYNSSTLFLVIDRSITIYGYKNSYANIYATRFGNRFVAIDDLEIIDNTPKNINALQKTFCLINVVAKGLNLQYQWYEVDGETSTPISGETQSSLSVPTLVVGTKQYKVKVTNWDSYSIMSEIYSVNVLPSYEVEIETTTGGEVTSASGEYIGQGENVVYEITLLTGYHVSKVVVDGVELSQIEIEQALVDGISFNNVNENHSIQVEFAKNKYSINVICGENGSISSLGKTLEYGENFTYTFTPALHFHIEKILVDGSYVGNGNSYAFVNISSNHTLEVVFAPNVYNIELLFNNGGKVTCDGALQNIAEGEDRTFTILPKNGCEVLSVKCNGAELILESNNFTISNITNDMVIEVEFSTNEEPPKTAFEIIIFVFAAIGVVSVIALPFLFVRKKPKV